MTKTFKTLIAATLATASIAAFAGELSDPTAGQPTSTVSQTGVTAADARYEVSPNNQIGLEPNPQYVAMPAHTDVASGREMLQDLYRNS